MSRRFILPGAAVLVAISLASVGILAGAASFTETFTGAPATPIAFDSSNWEVAYHSMHGEPLERLPIASQAQHGPNCESPGEDGSVTHTVTTYKDAVFQCKDHVMTHVTGELYDAVYLTPNQLVDLSNGPATIRFDVSTLSRSARDWISVWIQDWDTQEQRALDSDLPTAQGNPRNAIQIEMGEDGFESQSGTFHAKIFDANRRMTNYRSSGGGYSSVLTRSATARSTVEIVLSRTHIKVWMPQYNLVWVDRETAPLPMTQGIVSFAHHQYSAEKGTDPLTGSSRGRANTWHWDNMLISPSVPFTIVNSDHRSAEYDDSAAARTFTFDTPAPANSYLRFAAMGRSVNVSFDGGAAQTPEKTGLHTAQEHPTSYLIKVPQGTTRAAFQISPSLDVVGAVQNPTIFARTTPPPATPTATATATATATPTATATASATATPKTTATATATASATATPKTTATATATATGTVTPTPTKTPTATATATASPTPTSVPGGTPGATAECEAQFRYRDSAGRGVYREVWRAVNCKTGALLEPVR